jgi:hypothetical protein
MDLKLIKPRDFVDFFIFALKDTDSNRAESLILELNFFIQQKGLTITNLYDLIKNISVDDLKNFKNKTAKIAPIYSILLSGITNMSDVDFSDFLKTITIDLSLFSVDFLNIDLRILNDGKFIPGLLKNNLDKIGPTIKDIFDNHRIYKGTANHSTQEALNAFIKKLIEQSDGILNKYHQLTLGIDITKGIIDFSEDNLLQNLQIIYRNIIPNIQEKYNYQKIFELYFSENHPKLINLKNNDKKLEIIGHFIKPQKTKERIRQTVEGNSKVIGFKQIIYNLLIGGNYIGNTLFAHKMYANLQFISILNKFIDNNLKSYPIADRDLINSLIAQNQNDLIAHPEAVKIFFEILTPLVPAAKEQAGGIEFGTSRFSDSTYYIYPQHAFFNENTIDFYIFGNAIYTVLRKQVTPIDEITLFDEIRRETGIKLNKNQKNLIDSIMDIVPEFVKFTDEYGMNYYEIRFDRLSSIGDEIYRILHENGSPMSIADIEDALKEKYSQFKTDANYLTRSQIQNNIITDNITYLRGKPGYYKLKEWDLEDKDLSALVLAALKELGTASTSTEILENVKAKSPELETNDKILYSIVSYLKWKKIFPLLQADGDRSTKYILKEWEAKYKGQIQEKENDEKETRKLQAYKIISELENRPIPLRDLRNLLSKEHNFPRATIDVIIKDEKYFIRTIDTNSTILIDIVDEIKALLKDRITDAVIDYLKTYDKTGKGLLYSKLVKEIHQKFPTKHKEHIYKYINQRFDLFEKFEQNGNTLIRYIAEIDNASRVETQKEFAKHFSWEELKVKLEKELSALYYSKAAPKFIGDFFEIIELWNKIISQKTDNFPELSVLGNNFLPSVWKYFIGNTDAHDKKLIHKDILTSLEVFTLKIMYNTNQKDFNYHYDKYIDGDHTYTSGFGTYIKALRVIDHNVMSGSFKHDIDFSECIYTAYSKRNDVAHLGGDWTTDEIDIDIKSALIYCIYLIYRFKDKLKAIFK